MSKAERFVRPLSSAKSSPDVCQRSRVDGGAASSGEEEPEPNDAADAHLPSPEAPQVHHHHHHQQQQRSSQPHSLQQRRQRQHGSTPQASSRHLAPAAERSRGHTESLYTDPVASATQGKGTVAARRAAAALEAGASPALRRSDCSGSPETPSQRCTFALNAVHGVTTFTPGWGDARGAAPTAAAYQA